jgi:hypothetical protein
LELVKNWTLSLLERNSNEFCSVCLDPLLDGEKIVETPCNHLFHKRCLKTSYERGSDLCPNWRKNLKVSSSPEKYMLSEEIGRINHSCLSRSSFQSTDDT